MATRLRQPGVATTGYAVPDNLGYDPGAYGGDAQMYAGGSPNYDEGLPGGSLANVDWTMGGGFVAPGQFPTPEGPSPTPTQQPTQTYALGGYDAGKLADPNHNTDKYQVGRVLQQFDPKAGITPDVLAALNALGIADFSGQGDQLSVQNARNGGRWDNGIADIIQNFTGDGPATWTYIDTSSPVLDHTMGGRPIPGIPATSGGGGGVGAAPSPASQGPNRGDIWSMLTKLINGSGDMNNEILTRRVGVARDDMNSARKSATETYRAQLAERGLVGSGGEVLGASNLEEELASIFGNKEQEIIADESGRADDRMIQALSLATGLTMDDARNEIERYKADITRELGLGNINLGHSRIDLDRTLGLGNLALGNANLNQDWNRFMAQFGLDRERFANEVSNNNFDQLARLLQYALQGATVSGSGRV